VALSMEEQRILAQIEQELSRAEPRLAAWLSTFADPVPALWSARVRVMASVAALLMLAVASVVVYTFFTLRAVPQRGESARPTAASAGRAVSRHGSSQTVPAPAIGSPAPGSATMSADLGNSKITPALGRSPSVILRGQP
jgi:hypothetical protein